MQLPEFIIYSESGITYLLQSSYPNYIGQIVQFGSGDEMLDWIARKKVDNGKCLAGKIPGYNILVIPAGSMEKSAPLKDSKFLESMAEYYGREKIEPNKRRYKKYIDNEYYNADIS